MSDVYLVLSFGSSEPVRVSNACVGVLMCQDGRE